MFRLEKDRVAVVEVGIVLDLVESADVLKWVRIMVHFPHVVILEHGSKDVLWDVAECVLVLAKLIARIATLVDVDLQVLAIADVE